MNALTSTGQTELLVTLEGCDGETAFARYTDFKVGRVNKRYRRHHSTDPAVFPLQVLDESTGYELRVSGFDPESTAGDSLTSANPHLNQNGARFSARDRDQDANPNSNCARTYKG